MKTIALSWRYLWSRPLGAALNVLLLSLGLASITFLLLVSFQLSKAFDKDLAGIDVVVGAKGSPMQLIMCGVFHIDVPPGNIPLKAVKALENNPMIAAWVTTCAAFALWAPRTHTWIITGLRSRRGACGMRPCR